MHEDITES